MTGRVVMVLSNAFVSDPRVEKEAEALSSAGLEVTVLAWDREGSSPAEEVRGGARVVRFGPRARHGGGLSNAERYREFWGAAAARATAIGPDVVHCHDLDTAPVGLRVVGSRPRIRLVLDFHELYRESNMIPQRGAVGVAARAAVRVLERRAIPRADAVLVANPGAVPYYGRFGVGSRLSAIENAPDADVFRPRGGERPARPFTVGYFGQKRYLGGLAALVEAARALDDVAVLMAGGGTAADDVARLAAGEPRVENHGSFSYAQLPGYYERCDAVYAVYEAGIGNVRTLFPVKVMEAMACALPVVVAKGTWAGDYVERESVGFAVPPQDVAALTSVLASLRDDPETCARMGARGRSIVEGGLRWDAVAARLLNVYEGLLD